MCCRQLDSLRSCRTDTTWRPAWLTCPGARGTAHLAGVRSEACTNSRGMWPRATATAAPIMCRIWCSRKELAVNVTCSHRQVQSAHDLFPLMLRYTCRQAALSAFTAPTLMQGAPPGTSVAGSSVAIWWTVLQGGSGRQAGECLGTLVTHPGGRNAPATTEVLLEPWYCLPVMSLCQPVLGIDCVLPPAHSTALANMCRPMCCLSMLKVDHSLKGDSVPPLPLCTGLWSCCNVRLLLWCSTTLGCLTGCCLLNSGAGLSSTISVAVRI